MFQWFNRVVELSPAAAFERLRSGNVPDRLRVQGDLGLQNSEWLTYLPRELEAKRVNVTRCSKLRGLPEKLTCAELILRNTRIQCLSSGLNVSRRIDAQNCRSLENVFPLCVDHLDLQNCTLIERLPDGLRARRLQMAGCPRLLELPASIASSVEHLDVSNCASLTTLPENFARLQTLNVVGCRNLRELPDGIRIRTSIDVANAGLRSLPWSLRSVRILWRGLPVSDRVAFEPESITVDEIFHESNLTMRRILLDRVGMDWFLERIAAATVDEDSDPGGQRRLLRIAFPNGEAIVCLEVRCPSTGHRYVLRVPPRTRRCAEAAAWIAGYSNSQSYQPLIET